MPTLMPSHYMATLAGAYAWDSTTGLAYFPGEPSPSHTGRDGSRFPGQSAGTLEDAMRVAPFGTPANLVPPGLPGAAVALGAGAAVGGAAGFLLGRRRRRRRSGRSRRSRSSPPRRRRRRSRVSRVRRRRRRKSGGRKARWRRSLTPKQRKYFGRRKGGDPRK